MVPPPITEQSDTAVNNEQVELGEDILKMSPDEIKARTRLIDNEVRIMRSDTGQIKYELNSMKEKIKENAAKIKVQKKLPYLVATVAEVSHM